MAQEHSPAISLLCQRDSPVTKNWDVFGAIFTSQRAVESVMAQLNLLRGPIAHCSPMTADEIDRLNLSVKDWFRIMA